MSNYPEELSYAIRAAQAAAEILRPAFHGGHSKTVDKEADKRIYEILSSFSPKYGYHSEELGLVKQPGDARHHLWLVDPQDGTSAAQKGFRGAATSIALLRDGLPVLGVVFAYSAPDDTGDLFTWAEGSNSISRNNREISRSWPSRPTSDGTALISQEADSNAIANAELVAPLRFRGVVGIAYRLAMIAAGEGDLAVSLNGPTGWDVAGGHALLRGSGGDLFDNNGKPVAYGRDGTIKSGSLHHCFGGVQNFANIFSGRKWSTVFKKSSSPASQSLIYLLPGQTIPDRELLSRAQGCLLGQFAGDALGSLVEFQDAQSISRRYPEGPSELHDGGTWNTIAGQPTDDSELALCLARSLVQIGHYDEESAARAYAGWYDSSPFDMGSATSAALSAASRAARSKTSIAAAARGSALANTEANGALMRISPLGVFGTAIQPAELVQLAYVDAGLTHPHPVCRMASALFAAAIAYAIRTGRGTAATYQYALSIAREEHVPEPLMKCLIQAADRAPDQYTGWVLNAFQNAFFQLLHARSLEQGLVNTVRAGGDTDTNAAIAGALMGAIYGRDAIPPQWMDRILSCRPIDGLAGIKRPRSAQFWPVDALSLAERLLLAGFRTTGLAKFPTGEVPYSRPLGAMTLEIPPPLTWNGLDQVDPVAYSLTRSDRAAIKKLIAHLTSLRSVDMGSIQSNSGMGPDGIYVVGIPTIPNAVEDFFQEVWLTLKPAEPFHADSPIPHWLVQPDFIERANFPQLRRVLCWMQRGEHWCYGFWGEKLQDGSLIRVLLRLKTILEEKP
jgi:ADP-ribosylglycohydrolase/fructose-1,6-bisphosphatase/inositol monophosphatase family enzyme